MGFWSSRFCAKLRWTKLGLYNFLENSEDQQNNCTANLVEKEHLFHVEQKFWLQLSRCSRSSYSKIVKCPFLENFWPSTSHKNWFGWRLILKKYQYWGKCPYFSLKFVSLIAPKMTPKICCCVFTTTALQLIMLLCTPKS